MTDKPILFSSNMIRAMLDGRKTETRRIVKPQPEEQLWTIWKRFPEQHGVARWAPGDRLWVREAIAFTGVWADAKLSELDAPHEWLHRHTLYRADQNGYDEVTQNWRPSIHMPRWASRLTLLVKTVHVERLQEITDEHAIAEGVGPLCHPEGRPDLTWVGSSQVCRAPAYEFRKLWGRINDPGSWDANPWVTVTSYSVEKRNIDAARCD